MPRTYAVKRAIACAAAGLTVAMLAGCGSSSSGNSASGAPDVTTLFERAVKLVRATEPPTYVRAVILEADGTTAGHGPTTSAAKVVAWRFVFDNQPSRTRYRSAMLVYGPPPHGFGKPHGNVQPFLEDLDIYKAPPMTLAQAVSHLKRAGYAKPFSTVTLRSPLGPGGTGHPLFIFGFGNQSFVGVDTKTGNVARLSN